MSYEKGLGAGPYVQNSGAKQEPTVAVFVPSGYIIQIHIIQCGC